LCFVGLEVKKFQLGAFSKPFTSLRIGTCQKAAQHAKGDPNHASARK